MLPGISRYIRSTCMIPSSHEKARLKALLRCSLSDVKTHGVNPIKIIDFLSSRGRHMSAPTRIYIYNVRFLRTSDLSIVVYFVLCTCNDITFLCFEIVAPQKAPKEHHLKNQKTLAKTKQTIQLCYVSSCFAACCCC